MRRNSLPSLASIRKGKKPVFGCGRLAWRAQKLRPYKLLIILILISYACAPQSASESATTTHLPTEPEPRTLTVLAAASLTESFTELGKLFEARNPGVTMLFNFAGSQQLAQQLDQGAPADVFASASKKYMDVAITSDRVGEGSTQIFAQNRLVVIFPKENPANLQSLQDLGKEGLKLVLADASVPVGQYALDFMDKAMKAPGYDPQFKDQVLQNVVSYETDVKAVLAKVTLGEADAGIVYVTDITPRAAEKVGRLDIPDELNTFAAYPIAVIADSAHTDLGNAFLALVLSPEGQQVLGKYGFIPAAEQP